MSDSVSNSETAVVESEMAYSDSETDVSGSETWISSISKCRQRERGSVAAALGMTLLISGRELVARRERVLSPLLRLGVYNEMFLVCFGHRFGRIIDRIVRS